MNRKLYEAKIALEDANALLIDTQLIKFVYDAIPLDEAIKDILETIDALERIIAYLRKDDKND